MTSQDSPDDENITPEQHEEIIQILNRHQVKVVPGELPTSRSSAEKLLTRLRMIDS